MGADNIFARRGTDSFIRSLHLVVADEVFCWTTVVLAFTVRAGGQRVRPARAWKWALSLDLVGEWQSSRVPRGRGGGGYLNSRSSRPLKHVTPAQADSSSSEAVVTGSRSPPTRRWMNSWSGPWGTGWMAEQRTRRKNQQFGCSSLKGRPGFIFDFIRCFKNAARRQTSVENPSEATRVTLILMPNQKLTDRTLFPPQFHEVLHQERPSVTQIFTREGCWRAAEPGGSTVNVNVSFSLCLVNFSLH